MRRGRWSETKRKTEKGKGEWTKIGGCGMNALAGSRSFGYIRGAFELAVRIFEVSASWPKEERYALTDQVRRSSRLVCGNIAEAC